MDYFKKVEFRDLEALNKLIAEKVKAYQKTTLLVKGAIKNFQKSETKFNNSTSVYFDSLLEAQNIATQALADSKITEEEKFNIQSSYNVANANNQLNDSERMLYISAWNNLERLTDLLDDLDEELLKYFNKLNKKIKKYKPPKV